MQNDFTPIEMKKLCPNKIKKVRNKIRYLSDHRKLRNQMIILGERVNNVTEFYLKSMNDEIRALKSQYRKISEIEENFKKLEEKILLIENEVKDLILIKGKRFTPVNLSYQEGIKWTVQAIKENKLEDNILLKEIRILDISKRTYNSLVSNDIFYIGNLIEKTENDLLSISNLGRKSLKEIKWALYNIGLHIKDDSMVKQNGG